MTPEGKVKIWLRERMRQLYERVGFWHYAPPGGRFGQAGTMDDLWLIDGVLVAIESKSGEGGYDVTPLQRKRLEAVHNAGGVAAVMIGKDHDKLSKIVAEIERRRRLLRSALESDS